MHFTPLPGTVLTSKWMDDDLLLAEAISQFPNDRKAYLVGGYIRDKILGKQSNDLDFVISGDYLRLGSTLAKALGGSFFKIEKGGGMVRVVIPDQPKQRTVDISPLKRSIEEDLNSRDFTVNSLALDILKFKKSTRLSLPFDLIDVTSGWKDISKGKVRLNSQDAFKKDPLRLMRAVRLAAELGFDVEDKTKDIARAEAMFLKSVAPERIKEELFLFFSLNCSETLPIADELGIIGVIFPELELLKGVTQNKYHHLDVWEHTILTIEEEEKILNRVRHFFPQNEETILKHLSQAIEGNHPRLATLKLGTLLHDLGKPSARTEEQQKVHFYQHSTIGSDLAQSILKRLRFSKNAVRVTCSIIKNHMRPGFLAREEPPTEKAVRRFIRKVGDETIEVLILSLADRLATQGRLSDRESIEKHQSLTRLLMKEYCEKPAQKANFYPLIRGNDIIKTLGLEPGPIIGKLLNVVEEAQLSEEISSREEALNLVKNSLEKMDN